MRTGAGVKSVGKVLAYITWKDRLLVFSHVDFPDAGIQVPAGTIRPGETPEAAVVREASEETGISTFPRVVFLGETDFDFSPLGRDELHRRHFFHLPLRGPLRETWRHYETDAEDDSPPIAFEFYWLSLGDAAGALAGGHGQFLEMIEQGSW